MKRKRKGISYYDNKSIIYQTQAIKNYCEEANIELVASYSDIGYSGTTTQKPELLKMLEFLEKTDEKIDTLLFYSVDRFGRDLASNIELALKITSYVDKVVFVAERMTNSYEFFKMFLIFKSIMAEEERLSLLIRLSEGRKAKLENTKSFRGPTIPLGYVKKKDELILATIENTNDVVEMQGLETIQYIFWCYLSNISMRQIAKNLNRQFVLTKRNTKWSGKAVSYILRNGVYAGVLTGEMLGKRYDIKTKKVKPLINGQIHQFIQKRLEKEFSGRKPKIITSLSFPYVSNA